MSKESFEHLVKLLQNPRPEAVKLNQAIADQQRLAAVEAACRFRPQFMPITHTLPAAAAAAPIAARTDGLNHDVIVTGAITDGEDRNVRFYKDYESRAIVRYGADATALSLDAIAGHSVATAGYAGVKPLPQPYLIRQSGVLTLEMYQETAPGAEEIVSTVFCGSRVYRQGAEEGSLGSRDRAAVLKWIERRPAPETCYAVVPVTFDADGFATAETPRTDEPMMVCGFRSTFTDALVNVGFDSDSSFAKTRFPIWALCAEPDNNHRLFEMLNNPLFVPPNQQLLFSLVNTIDGTLMATNGNIEVMYQTV